MENAPDVKGGLGGIQIELPESILLATGQSRELFIKEARFLLALKMFELERISSGVAAQMCDMSRIGFLFRASEMGVVVADLDEEEMVREFSDD
ncbi:MAG: UPF0175 family protein [Magnetococcales bacterium]|nr:UPF0175 family protein [Magnetococcales bacterium]